VNLRDRDLKIVLCTDYSLAGQSQRALALTRDIVASNPQFSIRHYLHSQPYRDTATLDRLATALRAPGFPG
jgi:hypothetical protein